MGAEKVTAIERLARLPAVRQGAVVADRATPEEARILSLQRRAGNRAVAALLRDPAPRAVQRAISWKPSDLEVGRSWKDRVRTTFAGDTYSMIIEALKDFHAARDPKKKLYLARVIEWRTDDWLKRHADRASEKEATQRRMLENLNLEAMREVGLLRAEAAYLRDMKSEGGPKGGPGAFKGLYGTAKQSGLYSEKAEGLAAGGVPGGKGADEAAAEIVAKYRLSAAEIAAIRTYTLPDYAYINPATANADEWLKSSIKGAKGADHLKNQAAAPATTAVDPLLKRSVAQFGHDALGPGMKLLKQEGTLHAGMLSQAAAKLPKYAEPAYRGRRMSQADFDGKYLANPGAVEKFLAFSSTSKSKAIAQGYADGGGDVAPKATDTVSVLYEITMKDGRDISALSASLSQNEEEVLLLPGAALKVDQVTPLWAGNPGKPPATAWYKIKMTQVR